MLTFLNSRRIIQQSEEKPNTAGSYICSWIGWPWLKMWPSSPSLSSLSISSHSLCLLSQPLCHPLHAFFESVFLVRRRERRASGGLSFLRTGPSNMVYSCPETVSDVYVNQGERQQKRREDEGGWGWVRGEGEEGASEREREHEGRSLQKCQAMVHFSRQLKWGQGEEREKGGKEKKTCSGFLELFLPQVEKCCSSISEEWNWFMLPICPEKCTCIYHTHMCTTKLEEC